MSKFVPCAGTLSARWIMINNTMNKLTKILGLGLATAFLLGLSTTLTRSSMIGFFDILPVYILMIIAIGMMYYEAFGDKK